MVNEIAIRVRKFNFIDKFISVRKNFHFYCSLSFAMTYKDSAFFCFKPDRNKF